MRPEAIVAAPMLLAIALGSCRRAESGAEPSVRVVRCAPVIETSVSDSLDLRGAVAPLPDKDAQIASQVAGRILKLLVREGDSVAAGQPVAHIDDAPLEDEARAAEASLAKTRAEVKVAEATAARVRRVFEHGIAARQEVDDTTARAETALASQSEAEATVRRARRQVGRSVVRSPLSGVVIRLLRRTGELVDGTPATPILEVADPRLLELTVDATATDLVKVKIGQPAFVTFESLPGLSLQATVAMASPAVERATGLGVVRLSINLGAGAQPPIGVLGEAHIEVGVARRSPVVPREAVRLGPAGRAEVVVCGANGVANVRPVTRGMIVDAGVEATGVIVGESVAVEPVVGIADGEAIEISK